MAKDGIDRAHLFFTELDTQQIKLHPIKLAPWQTIAGLRERDTPDIKRSQFPHHFCEAHATETAFRHRGWETLRRYVRNALIDTGRSQRRIERFDRCGSECVVEISDDGQRFRLRANYCGDRWCQPCQRARARIVTEQLMKLMEGKETWFTTLTLREDGKTLTERRNRLLECFGDLRRLKLWRKNCFGGAYCVQITRGKHKDHWHVHLHCIHTGTGLHKSGLSDAWLKTTTDSWVVDSQRITDAQRQARYVARYASKGCEDDVLYDGPALREAIASLGHSRMLGTFGNWRGVEFEAELQEQTQWRRIGRLRDIAAAARAQEVWAIGCLLALGVEIDKRSPEIVFRDVKPKPFALSERKEKKDSS